MKTLLAAIILLVLCGTTSGAVITMNDNELFTAPAYEYSPFTVRITDLEDAPDILEYNLILYIHGPREGEMAWDEFGTTEGNNNVFVGKETFFVPFTTFVDDWTIEVNYGVNDLADSATLPSGNDVLAEFSIYGGNSLYDYYIRVDPDSYIIDSQGEEHRPLRGLQLSVIQPEPCTIALIIIPSLFILKRRKRRDYSSLQHKN